MLVPVPVFGFVDVRKPYAICAFACVDARKPYAICTSESVDVRKLYAICTSEFVDVGKPYAMCSFGCVAKPTQSNQCLWSINQRKLVRTSVIRKTTLKEVK